MRTQFLPKKWSGQNQTSRTGSYAYGCGALVLPGLLTGAGGRVSSVFGFTPSLAGLTGNGG